MKLLQNKDIQLIISDRNTYGNLAILILSAQVNQMPTCKYKNSTKDSNDESFCNYNTILSLTAKEFG
jgi:hypothetical protein